jgi:hypothetical protein
MCWQQQKKVYTASSPLDYAKIVQQQKRGALFVGEEFATADGDRAGRQSGMLHRRM